VELFFGLCAEKWLYHARLFFANPNRGEMGNLPKTARQKAAGKL